MFVYDEMPKGMLDHDDRIKHHNWILNLKDSTNRLNQQNRSTPINSTSGIKGVYLDNRRNKYVAHITCKSVMYLGAYKDFDNAVCARLAGEQCLDWKGYSPAKLHVQRLIGR